MNFKKTAEKIFFYIYRNPVSVYLFNTDMKRRASLPLTATKELARDPGQFAPYTNELHHPNDYYGEASTLKRYLGITKSYKFKFAINHGIVFSKNTNQVGTDSKIPSAVTFGKLQKDIDSQFKKYVYCIGPYIHYAKNLLSDKEVKKEKKRLGKTLLVFPSHSTPSGHVDYDYQALIRKIKSAGKGYKTIRICVYWKDILRGVDDIYREAGLECVTAGHVYDPNFLRRLKSIITMSDACMGNNVGSNVGYAIFMDKPYQIFWQEESVKGHKGEVKIIEDETTAPAYREVIKVLSKPVTKITAKQKKIIGYYWGFGQIKSKIELATIIKITEKIYK